MFTVNRKFAQDVKSEETVTEEFAEAEQVDFREVLSKKVSVEVHHP